MDETQNQESSNQKIPLIVGITLLLFVALGAYYIPFPSSWQKGIFITVLALSAAGIAAIIPGFIEIKHKGFLRAGGAIAVFCVVYFFRPQPSSANHEAFDFTVFIHGPGGHQSVMLENAGNLILDLDDDRRTPLIGEKGRTVFSGIPGKIKENGMRTTIGLDAPGFELTEPKKEYLVSEIPVYIEIKKIIIKDTLPSNSRHAQTLKAKSQSCVVFGLIKDKYTDKMISNARISLLCGKIITTKSESDGTFSFSVPGSYKGDRCLIRAESGNKSKELYIPICDPNPVELKIE